MAILSSLSIAIYIFHQVGALRATSIAASQPKRKDEVLQISITLTEFPSTRFLYNEILYLLFGLKKTSLPTIIFQTEILKNPLSFISQPMIVNLNLCQKNFPLF